MASLESAPLSLAASDVQDDPLFQYIVIRRDLQEKDGWPMGSLIAQGAHAAVAAVAEGLAQGDADTAAYVAPEQIDSMHKAVLEVKNLGALQKLAERLSGADIAYKMWREQPENIETCLASKPARKSVLSPHFKKGCSLCNWHAPKDAKPS
mmetsp:Transcript_29635/g.66427  ORF Transcript_29635/g.66427 Transcript_29635/m.66427 type:complete len:151 (+) Transcript_29635:166-618(+)